VASPNQSTKPLRPPDLSAHAYVVLGMLRLGARSGYDIKQLLDLIGRHFWTISFPQIYPELDRLQDHGFIRGKSDKRSGRRRKLYSITRAGERELDRWLELGDELPLEIRDLALVKILCASDKSQAIRLLADMRRRSEVTIALLEARSRPAAEAIAEAGSPFPSLTAAFGLELHKGIIRTCRKLERQLGS
jgi:PadR family transcriptional regulator AphA